MESERLLKILVERWHGIPKDIFHKIQTRADLIRDGRLDGAITVGQP